MISTITSTQIYKGVSQIIRKNDTYIYLQIKELWGVVEELSAMYDKKTRLQIYHEALSEYYSFLYVNLMSKDKRKMFMARFSHYSNPS